MRGVDVRRSEQFEMQHALDRGIQSKSGLATDDCFRGGSQQPRATRFTRQVFFDRFDATDRVFD